VTSNGSYVTKTSSFYVISRCESTMTSAQRLKPFSEVPGPRGLPLIGTLWDFAKPNGFSFNKMFEVIDISCDSFAQVLCHARRCTRPILDWPISEVLNLCLSIAEICFTEFLLQRVSIACYAERCISYDRFCLTDRPTVCLSQSGIMPKRLQLRSCGLHWRIYSPMTLVSSTLDFTAKFQGEHSERGRRMREG